MSKKLLFATLFVLCLLVTGVAVAEEAPDCPVTVLEAQAEDGTVVETEDGEVTTLEEILANNPQEPQAKYIDSGVCCGTNEPPCPTVSGYSVHCVSFASCYPAKKTCIYR